MPSRLWLDATVEPDTPPLPHPSTYTIPPVPPIPRASPVIPTRHSNVAQGSTADSRRRSTPIKPRKSSHQKTPPAPSSPEVISNLIDSLANISFPDPIDAEQLPPPPRIPSNTLRHARSFDHNGERDEQSTLRDAIQNQLNRVDDAAEPPTIRTTKHPSSYYQLGRKGNKWENALGITTNGNGIQMSHSNSSLASMASQEDQRSIKVKKNRRSNASSIESFKMDLSVKNAYKQTSTVRSPAMSPISPRSPTRNMDAHYTARSEHSGNYGKSAKSPTPSGIYEPILEDMPADMHDRISVASSKREGKKPIISSPSPLSQSPIISAPSVPDRRSSLLLRTNSNDVFSVEAQTTQGAQRTPGRAPAPEAASKSETQSQIPADEPKTLTSFDFLDGEDTEVTKRIRELKAKKQQRELEARDSFGPDSNIGSLRTSTNGDAPSPYANNKIHDAAGSMTKRSNKPQGLNLTPRSKTPDPSPDIKSQDPDRPPTPLTPTNLPINYSFIVQSLDEDRPPSRSGSVKTSATSNPVTKSTFTPSIITKSILGTKRDSSVGASPHRLRKDRKSLDASNTDPLLTQQRSGSLKGGRKRWSFSEVQNSVERHSSLKGVDSTNSRVSVQRDTVEEEISSMQDEINRAVEGFIHAQRLSQKIRHPQTGRVISFSEVGNPKGNVVFCCVGMGLTRFITAFYDELASTLNLRLITPDRPGVGNSETDPNGTPLSWADDVLLICSAMRITKFSVLAHSAGAIYALATALRIPQHIRGKVHLLAPWIPPSQMEAVGMSQDPPPGTQLPKSQRFLRALPTPFLKVANSSFLSATSASLSPNIGNPASKNKKRKSAGAPQSRTSEGVSPNRNRATPPRPDSLGQTRRESIMLMDQQNMPTEKALNLARSSSNDFNNSPASSPPTNKHLANALYPSSPHHRSFSAPVPSSPMATSFGPLSSTASPEIRKAYDEALTEAIWVAATTNANPAVDLLVCLERTHTIGFRYVDITRAVVIHHGAKDSRVPVDNVKWLGGMMRRCEVRVLEGEAHGLMASAGVMGGVLTEMAKEWEDWDKVISKGRVSN